VLVSQQAEKSRFRTLGEISTLIAHDLSSPLHVIRFCVDELKTDPRKIEKADYLNQLTQNVESCENLINSLRARFKNKVEEKSNASFMEVHAYVVPLLKTQFHTEQFQSISFEVDPVLNSFSFDLPQIDLVHILDNLYRNSVENLLGNSVSQPKISVKCHSVSEGSVQIAITDNGTGLSKEKFEQLTEFQFMKSSSDVQGLGLRLTRRMIELNGGSLEISAPLNPEAKGTTYILTLKTAVNVSVQSGLMTRVEGDEYLQTNRLSGS